MKSWLLILVIYGGTGTSEPRFQEFNFEADCWAAAKYVEQMIEIGNKRNQTIVEKFLANYIDDYLFSHTITPRQIVNFRCVDTKRRVGGRSHKGVLVDE